MCTVLAAEVEGVRLVMLSEEGHASPRLPFICIIIYIYIYIYVKLQLGFSPVAVVQQYNRQVTHITHRNKAQTQHKNTTINGTTTANT
jgi:hypothetical protein